MLIDLDKLKSILLKTTNLKIDPPNSIQNMSCSSEDCDTDQETDRLLGAQRTEDRQFYEEKVI